VGLRWGIGKRRTRGISLSGIAALWMCELRVLESGFRMSDLVCSAVFGSLPHNDPRSASS
jgi:hypothetical protein